MLRSRLAGWLIAAGAATAFLVLGTPARGAEQRAARPNIVWIVVEDMSAHFGCYGEKTIHTPHVDRLAAEGVLFRRAFVTAPVCSTARSALITGMYQTSIGAHHHRSGRGEVKIQLPSHVRLVPELFRAAGYYTCNGSAQSRPQRIAKTDYNFEWDPAAYDGADWSGRRPGQPFFAQIQLAGGKLRHAANWKQRAARELGSTTPPDDVQLPPYYPRDSVILDDWAQYLDAVRYTDREVGRILQRLADEGLADSTYVFFLTDHGISHARGKQFCYDEGIRIPCIVRGPGLPAGSVREDLIEHIDVAATSLALAGIEVPGWMQARNVLAEDYQPRRYVFAARDRCDETVDRIRSVRTERFKYIRNFLPLRPHLQPNRYKDHKEIVQRLRQLHAQGALDAAQSLIFAPQRPPEELYDLERDPHELHNLADEPAYREVLHEMRRALADWMHHTADQGRIPESQAQYDSDMAVYLAGQTAAQAAQLQANIALMKRWAAEGK
jgi:arylsulfatase A-like enzyme